jgi:Flp pilus assembly secretin CpaC
MARATGAPGVVAPTRFISGTSFDARQSYLNNRFRFLHDFHRKVGSRIFKHGVYPIMITLFQHGSSSSGKASTALLASTLVIAGLAIAASSAQANDLKRPEDLVVRFDQSQLIKLPRQISEVIVGNPSIADISVHSGNTLIVTGKGFGLTNLIVLDSERNVITEQRVMVQRDEYKTVNLTRGISRQTFNCAPKCDPTVTVGDDTAYFSATRSAMDQKSSQAEKSGTEAGGGAAGAQ